MFTILTSTTTTRGEDNFGFRDQKSNRGTQLTTRRKEKVTFFSRLWLRIVWNWRYRMQEMFGIRFNFRKKE